MPILSREGFTPDSILAINDYTLNNPIFTASILAFLARRSRIPYASLLQFIRANAKQSTLFYSFLVFFGLSLIKRASDALGRAVRNNWTSDVYDWTREIVLITGGSGGIGGSLARILAAKGIKVVVWDVMPLTYPAMAGITYFACDITDRETVSGVAKQVRQQVGNVTVLVNMAGIIRGSTILQETEEEIKAVFGVNLFSHYWLTQEFVPHMIALNHGHIVSIASLASYLTPPRLVDYCCTKAGVASFHEGLGMELKHFYNAPKVRTTIVNPNFVRTPLLTRFEVNGRKFQAKTLHVETVAEAIAEAILSGESRHVILPRMWTCVAGIRGWADWLHYGGLSSTAKDLELLKRDDVSEKAIVAS